MHKRERAFEDLCIVYVSKHKEVVYTAIGDRHAHVPSCFPKHASRKFSSRRDARATLACRSRTLMHGSLTTARATECTFPGLHVYKVTRCGSPCE